MNVVWKKLKEKLRILLMYICAQRLTNHFNFLYSVYSAAFMNYLKLL